MLSAGGLQRPLRGNQRLPCASPRQFCSSPTAATAEPVSDAGGTILQMCLRKGKTLPRQWGLRKKKSVRNSPAAPRWEGGGIALQSPWRDHGGAGALTAVNRQPMMKYVYPAGSCSPWEGPMLEHAKAWGGRSSRKGLLRTDHNLHSPFPCPAWGWGGKRGVGNEVEPEMKRVKRKVV